MKMILGLEYNCGCTKGVVTGISQGKTGLEIKSGQLYMVRCINNKIRKMPVFVRVYKNTFEHYAVIYKNQTFTNSSTYVSLKNCVVIRDGSDIKIVPNTMEGNQVLFSTKNPTDVDDWVSVLQSRDMHPSKFGRASSPQPSTIPRSPLMPILSEMDEES